MILKSLFAALILVALAAAAAANGYRDQKKTNGGLVGGFKTINSKDASPGAADLALEKFESSMDALEGSYNNMYKLTKPVTAQVESQVVAGTMYRFTVLAGLSTCRKGQTDFSSCSLEPEPLRKAFIECRIKVWVKPWMNFMQAQDFSIDEDCQPSKLMIPERN